MRETEKFLDEEVSERLAGIVKTYRGRLQDADLQEILTTACQKMEDVFARKMSSIDGMRRSGYLREVVKSVIADHCRARGIEIPISAMVRTQGQSFDDFLDSLQAKRSANNVAENAGRPKPAEPPGWDDEPSVPLCVIETRLRLVFATGESQAQELICYAYWAFFCWSPQKLVESLGQLTLGRLAESFLTLYSQKSGIPQRHLVKLLVDIDEIRKRPEGDTKLQSYWNPEELISRWVESVADRVRPPGAGPPVFSEVDFSEAAGLAMNRRVVYLLSRWLGRSYAEILGLAMKSPDDLAAYFVDRFPQECESTPADFPRFFQPLIASSSGGRSPRPLQSYFSPSHTVTEWNNAVCRRLRSGLFQQEREGLRVVFGTVQKPEQTLAFLLMFVLKWQPKQIVNHYLAAQLTEFLFNVRDHYRDGYAKKAEEHSRRKTSNPDAPPEATVAKWFKPVADQIEEKQIGQLQLSYYIEWEQKENPDLDPAAVVARWRTNVLSAIKGGFDCRKTEAVLFAWRLQLLAVTPGQRREQARP